MLYKLILITTVLIVVVHALNVRDMLKMARVSGVAPSPSGRLVAYSTTLYNGDNFASTSSIYVVDSKGVISQVTNNNFHDSSPAWYNDDVLLFLSDRSGSRQIWSVRYDGSHMYQVTNVSYSVDTFKLSPTQNRIAFSASVPLKMHVSAGTSSGRVYTQLMVRHWDVWRDNKRSHVLTVGIHYDGVIICDNNVVDLMANVDGDCPVPPTHDKSDYAFTSDGQRVAMSIRLDGHAMSWTTKIDIYLAYAAGPGGMQNMKLLTPNHVHASDWLPQFSPNGRTMAYLSQEQPQDESDRARIKLLDLVTGAVTVLTDVFDRSFSYIVYSADGTKLYATASDHARIKLFVVDVDTGAVSVLHEIGVVSDITPVSTITGDVIFCKRARWTMPDDVYYINVAEASEDHAVIHRLTNINKNILDPIPLSVPEEFHFTGANDDTVQGWYFAPVNYSGSGKWPFVMYIHGGPESSFNDAWSYRWNPNTIASQGYGVVIVNFHGSDSFGQNFTDSVAGDWGGKPYKDIMMGMEYALRTWPYLDRGRAGAMGASYGGYMAYWIAGHTDVFKAIISHDGQVHVPSRYGTTDELWFAEYEFKGLPWQSQSKYRESSPHYHVTNWKTPMLVIHSEKDFRLSIDQGLSAFTFLQRLGVESKFLYFPDENHWVLKPANSILWHDTVIDWLNTHV